MEWLCVEHLAVDTVQQIDVAVAIGVHERLARRARPVEVDQDAFIDPVVVVQVVRPLVIEPDRLAGVGVARKFRRSIEHRPAARVGFQGPGSRTVIEQVGIGVVGQPAPHRAAADPPGVRRPALDPQIRAAVPVVERLARSPINTSWSGPVL